MATYKVIQDIEAEDKLVGPLSLKQFIYACIAVTCGYLSFLSVTKGVSFFLVIVGPIAIFTGFFAFPWGRDQPTEIWALAKIRYFLKPRRRIWDQSGVKELVNITAPKHIERVLTNNLTENQVQSRLTALASTLDSRGWAVKNINLNMAPVVTAPGTPDTDRLIGPSNLPQEVASVDITAGDDILDEVNNPRAQRLEQMISSSSEMHRSKLIDQLRSPVIPTQPPVQPANRNAPQLPTPAEYWYLNKPMDMPPAPTFDTSAFTPNLPVPAAATLGMVPQAANPTPDEEALVEQLRRQREKSVQGVNYQHMKVVLPLSEQRQNVAPAVPTNNPAPMPPPVTPHPNPATMELVNRDDLTIATIANIANKQDEHLDEVVIPLHHRHSS